MTPPIKIHTGTVEALKWLALILMTGDHINKYLYNNTLPLLYQAGRLAMPVFIFILAYNLARPGQYTRGTYLHVMVRLAVFGAIACIPYIALNHVLSGWWPLNILITLLVLTATLYLIERDNLAAAAVVFVVGGSITEFWWPSVTFGVAVWAYCKQPHWIYAATALLACAALYFINGNGWALAAIPVVLCASQLAFPVPRLRWIFYIYYPLHLYVLWLIRIPMSHAGYLFF